MARKHAQERSYYPLLGVIFIFGSLGELQDLFSNNHSALTRATLKIVPQLRPLIAETRLNETKL